MKYLVTIQSGAEIHFDDPGEPMIIYLIKHENTLLEEILIFRGGVNHEYIIAFNPVPHIRDLSHSADALCNGHLCKNAEELVSYIASLKGLRLDMARLMLQKDGVKFPDIREAMQRSLEG